jgi:hypothetical protein
MYPPPAPKKLVGTILKTYDNSLSCGYERKEKKRNFEALNCPGFRF